MKDSVSMVATFHQHPKITVELFKDQGRGECVTQPSMHFENIPACDMNSVSRPGRTKCRYRVYKRLYQQFKNKGLVLCILIHKKREKIGKNE